jgi:UDP-3-O-[3-hydroxymyristoyl] N-acetylglucosamine deacetylase
MLRQRTIRSAVSAAGVGLHSGQKVSITLCPAHDDTGVVFRRTDLDQRPTVHARADQVIDTRLSTCLEENGIRVGTVEHLLSALAGLGVDNTYVELTGPEVPIMDGSANPFVYLVSQAGIREQRTAKKYFRIREPIEVRQGDKWARLTPYSGFRLDFTVDFPHPVFGADNRHVMFDFARNSYVKEVARARTFGFMHEVEWMRSQGLAQGGSLDNAVVLDEYRVLNAEGFRYDNELVKHKLLDAIGDLYLIGGPLIGQYTAYKSGHAINNALARALLADLNAFEEVKFETETDLPRGLQSWFPPMIAHPGY